MRKRILVVDDDVALLKMLHDALKTRGLNVTACADSVSALSRIRGGRFDAALFDIRMPGPSGFDLLSAYRERQPDAPAFVLSGSMTSATLAMADALGARSFDKPFDLDRVCAVVAEAAGASRAAHPWSILIVDDDPTILNLMHAYLSDLGFFITKANDGIEALQLVRAAPRPFDIALVDINMPNLDGVQLIRELDRLTPETLPVIMTGEATSKQVREAYRAGAETLMRKPFDFNTLPGIIEALETTLQERRTRAAERRAIARRTRIQKWAAAGRRFWAEPLGTRCGEARLGLFAAAVALAALGIVNWIGDAIEESSRRQIREREEWTARVAARFANSAPAGVGIEAAPTVAIDPGQVRQFEGLFHKVAAYLQRDEARELNGRDAPITMGQ